MISHGTCLLAKKRILCYLFSELIDFTRENVMVAHIRMISEQGNRDNSVVAGNGNPL